MLARHVHAIVRGDQDIDTRQIVSGQIIVQPFVTVDRSECTQFQAFAGGGVAQNIAGQFAGLEFFLRRAHPKPYHFFSPRITRFRKPPGRIATLGHRIGQFDDVFVVLGSWPRCGIPANRPC